MNVEEIRQAALRLQTALTTTYGYDAANYGEIKINIERGSITCTFLLEDDFQGTNVWDSSSRIQIGYQSFEFESGSFTIPPDFKMREMRELHYLARKMGDALELSQKFQSAAGREFAEKMSADIASLRTMIAGPQQ